MIAAYVYPGWHPIPERDVSFYPGFTEWDLVLASPPRFEGHYQPRRPALGPYDDRDPGAVGQRVALAAAHGVEALVYGAFWCRGKRVFEAALDDGFLRSPVGDALPFALMWANRMPRRVLPVRRVDAPLIDPERLVDTDVDDFVAMIACFAERYFVRRNYLRLDGRLYFSIFDSTYFVKELGRAAAATAIARARALLRDQGLGELHLGAIEPSYEVIADVRAIGFDSVTHYVFLPEWRGPSLQDYRAMAEKRAGQWASFAERSELPYFPSVSPGWDASPRGADFAEEGQRIRPDKYPWSPVIVGEHPDLFAAALGRARAYARRNAHDLVFIASLNEWSEGHYLEPDDRWGEAWLRAVGAS